MQSKYQQLSSLRSTWAKCGSSITVSCKINVQSYSGVDDEYLSYLYNTDKIKEDVNSPHIGGRILELTGLKMPESPKDVRYMLKRKSSYFIL